MPDKHEVWTCRHRGTYGKVGWVESRKGKRMVDYGPAELIDWTDRGDQS